MNQIHWIHFNTDSLTHSRRQQAPRRKVMAGTAFTVGWVAPAWRCVNYSEWFVREYLNWDLRILDRFFAAFKDFPSCIAKSSHWSQNNDDETLDFQVKRYRLSTMCSINRINRTISKRKQWDINFPKSLFIDWIAVNQRMCYVSAHEKVAETNQSFRFNIE